MHSHVMYFDFLVCNWVLSDYFYIFHIIDIVQKRQDEGQLEIVTLVEIVRSRHSSGSICRLV